MKRFLYLISILLILSACKEVFEAPPQSLLQMNLYNSSKGESIISTVSALGAGLDSLWIQQENLKSLLLPLSAVDTTRYIVSFDSIIDTLTFFHETTQKYASMETGFYLDYKLDSVDFTHNRIDSVLIADSLVSTTWHENIKLYIRPLSSGGN